MTRDAAAVFDASAPMEARSADRLPDGDAWWFEPKWDGFRCLASRDGEDVRLRAKSGKSLSRYFPEVVEMLRAVAPDRFIVDGELLVQDGQAFSFEALQMRLHPSERRIRKLAEETPATLMLFDMLVAPSGEDLRTRPLAERRQRLRLSPPRRLKPGAYRLRRAPLTARSPKPGSTAASWRVLSPSDGTAPTSKVSAP
jgi:ATP-dependent DNA ligase